jgi:hypothetical protein
MDGVDDFGVVDSPGIHRGDREVGGPELALNDVHRGPLAGELDSVRVAELVPGEPSPQTSRGCCCRSCLREADCSQWRPAVGPWITHSGAPTGGSGPHLEP